MSRRIPGVLRKLGTAASKAVSFFLQTSNNLSDLPSATTARSNLGLGTASQLAASAVLQPGTTNTVTVGYTLTPNALGNITSFTVNPALGNYQYGTNHGAATWTAPASDCAVDILVTNDASAGAITFSGFTVGTGTGDALTTVNTNKFIVSIRRINSVSTYTIKALQ